MLFFFLISSEIKRPLFFKKAQKVTCNESKRQMRFLHFQAVHVRHRLIDAAWETEILAKVSFEIIVSKIIVGIEQKSQSSRKTH